MSLINWSHFFGETSSTNPTCCTSKELNGGNMASLKKRNLSLFLLRRIFFSLASFHLICASNRMFFESKWGYKEVSFFSESFICPSKSGSEPRHSFRNEMLIPLFPEETLVWSCEVKDPCFRVFPRVSSLPPSFLHTVSVKVDRIQVLFCVKQIMRDFNIKIKLFLRWLLIRYHAFAMLELHHKSKINTNRI